MIEYEEGKLTDALIDDYERQLELAYRTYIRTVESIASRARQEVIVPFLKRRNWEFLTGNGTWAVNDQAELDRIKARGDSPWHFIGWDKTDDLPSDIDRCLRLEIEGSWGNGELGLWMQDYTTKKTKNGGGNLDV